VCADLVSKEEFINHDKFELADVAVSSAFGRINIRSPECPWMRNYLDLATYTDMFGNRENLRRQWSHLKRSKTKQFDISYGKTVLVVVWRRLKCEAKIYLQVSG
jgi:hypothetical protein